jgi:aminopeptidase N
VIAGLVLLAVCQDPLAIRADSVRPRHDAIQYDVFLNLPETGTHLRAAVTIRWKLGSTEPVRLDLDTTFVVQGVTIGDQPASWQRQGFQIYIAHAGRAGDEVTTTIRYEGSPRDGLVIRGDDSTRTFFADNWPDRARRWLASQDHPADKASVRWTIEAPAGLTLVATGQLDRADTAGSRVTWRFSMPEPVPVHTMVLGAARFATIRLPPGGCAVRCIPLSVLSYPADAAWAAAGPFRRASEMIDLFDHLFGPFPYGELRHVQSSTIFGGMENSTAIFYDERSWRSGMLSEGTVAHETAHQWFGDAVSQADWHHLWLSEGFATYGAALWWEHVGGAPALQKAMQQAADGIRRNAAQDRPIIDTAQQQLMELLNANNYEKGSWVLHSLRGLVGDSAFFRGLRAYYARYRNGNALSRDFANVMGEASGQNLDWYFRQALTQPGYPVFDVSTRLAGDSVVVELTQVQPASWGIYRLPNLALRLNGAPVRFDVTGRRTSHAFPAEDNAPIEVQLDPEGWWLLDVKPGATP